MFTCKQNCVFLAGLIAMAAAVEPVAALAQGGSVNPIERRLHPGQGYWGNQRAARSMQHARDYTIGLHDYTIRAERIAPTIAQSEAEGVTRNLQATHQNLAVVREAAPDGQAVRASIGKIEQHLKKAAELHQALHEECHRQEIDREATAECCNDLIKELDLAIAEHGALMRQLERAARNQEAPSSR